MVPKQVMKPLAVSLASITIRDNGERAGRTDVGCKVYDGFSGRTREPMANGGRLAGSRHGVLCLVVLAAATMARFPRGNGGRGTLAMAGSVIAGIRCCSALRLGLRVDGTPHTCPGRSAAAIIIVAVGFYRYVRNPMYMGSAAGWIGLWVVFEHANPVVIAAVAAVALGVHLFVVFYEEPTLRKKFGADYEEYCHNVRRWWPRLRGWDKSQ